MCEQGAEGGGPESRVPTRQDSFGTEDCDFYEIPHLHGFEYTIGNHNIARAKEKRKKEKEEAMEEIFQGTKRKIG